MCKYSVQKVFGVIDYGMELMFTFFTVNFLTTS